MNNVTPEECHRVSSHPGVTHATPSACPLLSDTRNPRLHSADDVKFCVAVKGLFALARHSTMLSVHDLTLFMENPRDPHASANNTSLKLFLHLLQGGIHYISRLRVPVSELGMTGRKTEDKLIRQRRRWVIFYFIFFRGPLRASTRLGRQVMPCGVQLTRCLGGKALFVMDTKSGNLRPL